MAAASDDDVPERETATDRDESSDGDTTAAAMAPAARPPSVAASNGNSEDEDEDDRTVQQPVDPKVREAGGLDPPQSRIPAPAPPRPAPPAPPMRMTSKKATAVGLGSPLPVSRPASGYVPPPMPSPSHATEADAEDGSITRTSPAPRMSLSGAPLPLTMPGVVQIREMDDADDEALDETEVRTLVGAPPADEPSASSSPAPAAGQPPSPSAYEADELDDSVTTQAPSAVKNARLPEDEPPTSRVDVARPTPAAGRRPGEDRGPYELPKPSDDPDAYDAEESITTRGPVMAAYEDDSVTAQGPVTRPGPRAPASLGLPPALDDTGGETKPLPKRQQASPTEAALDPSGSDDEEPDSVTAQAPGHLTNMLRVIATPSEAAIEDDEPIQNKTAVMLNAPVKPMNAPSSAGSLRAARPVIAGASGQSGGARAAAIADLREPSSDSGLRVARAEAQSGDHASLAMLMAPGPMMHHHDRGSGPLPTHGDINGNRDVGPIAFGSSEQGFHAHGMQPSLREIDFNPAGPKPRYGLLVGLVAVLSFAIPIILFLWLHQGADDDEIPPRSTSEVAPDFVGRGDPARVKATKPPPPPPHTSGGGRSFPRRR
ncbi:MAG: hypothetical protein BGO98_49545 [Myxococcales bacterium 68-20]|nr:hypothetical protein [Myxococcales bacterium]OJY29863.1 MAG: hypothetical protein BGO98_49545 [Myxococcales bacterium 68-20]